MYKKESICFDKNTVLIMKASFCVFSFQYNNEIYLVRGAGFSLEKSSFFQKKEARPGTEIPANVMVRCFRGRGCPL
ncbi:hypothetical protein GRO01_21230 [Gluconobacter roseus NBRC 3990]|uniref:Uncharacterized protein n=1 Tax=Gluconobacter roseus NBRC 3990 TaxID=1307950 RepID=A0A4Y3M7V6_9PROT|nr:hypothetical protein GRO01_21230 [Gluconobacter roseus NBRC 3990]GLP92317.1 hypothetical protein GCM10007871_02950 [Gluconobacter roseus NBRC 3990]